MGIPFNFGLVFLIEIYISGLILSISLYPFILQILKIFGIDNLFKFDYLFFFALIIGLILDIYYYDIHGIFVGKYLWPSKARDKRKEHWRKYIECVQKKIKGMDKNSIERKRYEFFLDRQFPKDKDKNYIVISPTKLGNLTFTYEYNYPQWRYNIDSIYTYHYIMLNLDKEHLEIIQLKHSRSRFTIFSSFSFLVTFIIYLFLAVSFFIGIWWAPFKVEPVFQWHIYLIFSILSFTFSVFLYVASCEANRVYGEFYNAAIDINIEGLKDTFNKIQKYSIN